MPSHTDPTTTQATDHPPRLEEEEGEGWTVSSGKISTTGRPDQGIGPQGVEPLTYNNPFVQSIERVWYDGKLVFALSAGKLDLPDAGHVKVAKEYQPVYAVKLDQQGKAMGEPEKVPGQYNIYDSVPGQAEYSPIWQFYYVEVPHDYEANSLRSAQDCEQSGYPIHQSNDFEN